MPTTGTKLSGASTTTRSLININQYSRELQIARTVLEEHPAHERAEHSIPRPALLARVDARRVDVLLDICLPECITLAAGGDSLRVRSLACDAEVTGEEEGKDYGEL